MKKKELTGLKFGKLTVLYELAERRNGKIYWHCKCECGKEKDVYGSNLTSGKSQSCGECSRGENLINQKFGRLTVIEKTNKRASNGGIIWKCKCKCGNKTEVRTDILKNGESQSCGCLQKEIAAKIAKEKAELKILPKGTKFGKLTILKLLEEKDKYQRTIYECKCECGNITKVPRNDLISGNTQSCGCIKSKGELKISQILKNNNIFFEQQKIFENCRFLDTNYPARFDFYVQNKYIIEFDGEQHFKYYDNKGWNTKENFDKVKEHDRLKNEYCKEHNIPLIRIPYTHLKNICIEDLKPETSQFLVQ